MPQPGNSGSQATLLCGGISLRNSAGKATPCTTEQGCPGRWWCAHRSHANLNALEPHHTWGITAHL